MTPPGFKFGWYKIKTNHESIMRCEFLNGYKKIYYLRGTAFSEVLADIKKMNEVIELQRAFAGNEDILDEDTEKQA